VVVADAGMLCAGNLAALEGAGLSFIASPRVSKAPYDLADQLANRGNFFADGQTIEATRPMGTGKQRGTGAWFGSTPPHGNGATTGR
jgi:hypothetical protein